MKILIITQKIDRNDSVLGFFCGWVEEFSKHCEQVTVIALGVGVHNLPKNVRVFSLGKERGVSRVGYLYNFYRLIFISSCHLRSCSCEQETNEVKLCAKKMELLLDTKHIKTQNQVNCKEEQNIITNTPFQFSSLQGLFYYCS